MPDTTQTNIATEITRIQNDRNTIRTKLVELGMAESTANLDALATAISGITNQGAVSATVQEGDTYTIPKGYHNGSGTVSGVSGGGKSSLVIETLYKGLAKALNGTRLTVGAHDRIEGLENIDKVIDIDQSPM